LLFEISGDVAYLLVEKEVLKKILVPTDGSPLSVIAEETAASIAKKTGASITAFYVLPELWSLYPLPRGVENELQDSVHQRSDIILNSAQTLFKEENVQANTETASGDAAEKILEFSKEGYDLITMGAHGEDETELYVLGSVTRKVIMHADCPLLITKKVTSLSRMLVCVDGSQRSKGALDYALKLGEKVGSEITLINVQEHALHKVSPKVAEEHGARVLESALTNVGKTGLKVERILEIGVPWKTILEVSKKGEYDIIVVGRRGTGTVRRFLLGSVSDSVSQKAECSVLMVPERK
jgi:nucleotide-binding universal stress UspA family protein